MCPFGQIQPNNPEQIPGFIPEETPEERRKGIETFEPGEKPIKPTYTGERLPGFMGIGKTTEHIAKVQKFDRYKEEMKNASIGRLKDFIIWCGQGMAVDKDYLKNYRELRKEAAELLLSKTKLKRAAGELPANEGLINIKTVKNVFDSTIDELKEEEMAAQESGNELEVRRSQNLANKYRVLILEAEDLEKMIRT